MQKAQSSSQPSWMLTKARVRSEGRSRVGQPTAGSPRRRSRSRSSAGIRGLAALPRTKSAPVRAARPAGGGAAEQPGGGRGRRRGRVGGGGGGGEVVVLGPGVVPPFFCPADDADAARYEATGD